MPKAIYIMDWTMETYGYIEDCPVCVAKSAGMSLAKTHFATCRNRVEDLGETEVRQTAKVKAEERWVHLTAKEIKKQWAKDTRRRNPESHGRCRQGRKKS